MKEEMERVHISPEGTIQCGDVKLMDTTWEDICVKGETWKKKAAQCARQEGNYMKFHKRIQATEYCGMYSKPKQTELCNDESKLAQFPIQTSVSAQQRHRYYSLIQLAFALIGVL